MNLNEKSNHETERRHALVHASRREAAPSRTRERGARDPASHLKGRQVPLRRARHAAGTLLSGARAAPHALLLSVRAQRRTPSPLGARAAPHALLLSVRAQRRTPSRSRCTRSAARPLLRSSRCARSAARPPLSVRAKRRTPSSPRCARSAARPLPLLGAREAPHALCLGPRSAARLLPSVRAQRRTRCSPVRAKRRTPSAPGAREAPHARSLSRCARSAARPRAGRAEARYSRMPGTKTSQKSWKTRSRSANKAQTYKG